MTAHCNRHGGRDLEILLEGEVSHGVFAALQEQFNSGDTRAGVTIYEFDFSLRASCVHVVIKGTRTKR